MNNKRFDGRSFDQIRFINVTHNSFGYADASVLFEQGKTKILVSVTLQDSVPRFLRGQKKGWLTAEYAMLPCATQKRTNRESSQSNKNARSVEISRLIGRCLRSVTDLSLIRERSILIDCDVLQADGGTRVASITAASIALDIAIKKWIQSGKIVQNILKEKIAAISVGIVNNNALLDLSFIEDSHAQTDFNFIITESQKIIEIQGTAEKQPLPWEEFEKLKNLAIQGAQKVFEQSIKTSPSNNSNNSKNFEYKKPFFSLGNRLEKTS